MPAPQILKYSDKFPEGLSLYRKPILVRVDLRLDRPQLQPAVPKEPSEGKKVSPEMQAYIGAATIYPVVDYLWVGRAEMLTGKEFGLQFFPVAAFVNDPLGEKAGKLKGMKPKGPPFVYSVEIDYLFREGALYRNEKDNKWPIRVDANVLSTFKVHNKFRARGTAAVFGPSDEPRYRFDNSQEDGDVRLRAVRRYPGITFYDPNPQPERVVIKLPRTTKQKSNRAAPAKGDGRPVLDVEKFLDEEVERAIRKARGGDGKPDEKDKGDRSLEGKK